MKVTGVSIVMAAYNSERFLAAALESVLAQTVSHWELVIVNDGSSDRTGIIAAAYASRDERIRVLHQENAGVAQARNRGFAAARADYEYCMLLDHDDLLEPDALETLLRTLSLNPTAVAAHGALRFIDNLGQPLVVGGMDTFPDRRRSVKWLRLRLHPVSAPTTFNVLAFENVIPTCAILMRREYKDKAGRFDPEVVPADDWDMWLRLSRLGNIAFSNKVVYGYRLHETNFSHRYGVIQAGALSVRRKLYRSSQLKAREKVIMLLGYRYHELYHARLCCSRAARKFTGGRLKEAFQHLMNATRHVRSSFMGLLHFGAFLFLLRAMRPLSFWLRYCRHHC